MGLVAQLPWRFRRRFILPDLEPLRQAVVELESVDELMQRFGWQLQPVVTDPLVHDASRPVDANERRLRDAECLGTVVRNAAPLVSLEIGTAQGRSTALMAENSPGGRVFTVNILPEELEDGAGGKRITGALSRDEIGSYYRERGLENVTQIYANTAVWEPEIGEIEVAFIDGCHDTEFVYNDTRKILTRMRPGSFLLWHDFNLDLARQYEWIYSVCLGVRRLVSEGWVAGPIYHVRHSWIGIYPVPGQQSLSSVQ